MCHATNCKSPVFPGSPLAQCAAHLSQSKPAAFRTLVQRSPDVDLSEVVITATLLDEVLTLCSKPGSKIITKPLSFEKAVFEDAVVLFGYTFSRHTLFDKAVFQKQLTVHRTTFTAQDSFSGATFHGPVSFFGKATTGLFDGCTFKSSAMFAGCTFPNGAFFLGATFEEEAAFGGATFGNGGMKNGPSASIIFERAVFRGVAQFQLTDFEAKAIFTRAQFHEAADFTNALFTEDAMFDAVRFESDVDMKSASCGGTLNAEAAKFRGDASLDLVSAGELVLKNVDFKDRAIIRATTKTLDAQGCRFREGGSIGLRYAVINCSESRFESASTMSVAPAIVEAPKASRDADPEMTSMKNTRRQRFSEAEVVKRWVREARTDEERKRFDANRESPKLVSLENADVSGLHIADTVDLSVCRFVNAHNLEKIRFEGRPKFSNTPPFRARRMVIVEEQLLRRHSGRQRSGDWELGAGLQPRLDAPSARHIQSVYRSLRKGLEDSADQPGAGDFYYGEMEMRRWALRTEGFGGGPLHQRLWRWLGRSAIIGGTRVVLFMYWLLSGYALRASRAILGLFFVLVLGAVLLKHGGFVVSHDPRFGITWAFLGVPYYTQLKGASVPSFWESFSYVAQTVVLKNPEVEITTWGRAVIIGVRIVGVALLGLFALSIRGRVKR